MSKTTKIIILVAFLSTICFSNESSLDFKNVQDSSSSNNVETNNKSEDENTIKERHSNLGTFEIAGGAMIALVGTGVIIVGSTFPKCSDDPNAPPFSNFGPCGPSPALILSGAGMIIAGAFLVYLGSKSKK